MEFTDKKFRKESFQQGKDLVGKMIFDLRKEEEKRHEDRTDQDIEIAERIIDSIEKTSQKTDTIVSAIEKTSRHDTVLFEKNRKMKEEQHNVFSNLLENIIEKINAVAEKESTAPVVNVKENQIDIQGIVDSIQAIKFPDQKDYTKTLNKIIEILSYKEEKKPDHSEERHKEKRDQIMKIQELLKNVSTSQDVQSLLVWLKKIAERPSTKLPSFEFRNGRLLVEVDRTGGGGGGGGGGLTDKESQALQDIPSTD